MDASDLQRHFVAVMAKHLPPSGSTLHLLDLDGSTGALLSEGRADLLVRRLSPQTISATTIASDSFDAAVAFDLDLTTRLLEQVIDALRPGGRFIALNSRDSVDESQPRFLSGHGYTRILVEPALDGLGVLLRGEKPHTTSDTIERVRSVAQADADLLNLVKYRGRYLHLLIRQQPNKPAWKLTPSDTFVWHAIALAKSPLPVLLAFSSLPKAVNFMQQAVLAGVITDINKVGKFSRATAASWTWRAVLNPTLESIHLAALTTVRIDPATAEAPDE